MPRTKPLLTAIAVLAAAWNTAGQAAQPAFDCARATDSSIETLVCRTPALAALDHRLDRVFRAAAQRADGRQRPPLRAEQRGWIKGRNDCWKADDPADCARDAYVRRIAELQALYRLVPMQGPLRFSCPTLASRQANAGESKDTGDHANDDANGTMRITLFSTRPPTLIAEHGDRRVVLYREDASQPSRYGGGNETVEIEGNRAWVIWGYGTPRMHCLAIP